MLSSLSSLTHLQRFWLRARTDKPAKAARVLEVNSKQMRENTMVGVFMQRQIIILKKNKKPPEGNKKLPYIISQPVFTM